MAIKTQKKLFTDTKKNSNLLKTQESFLAFSLDFCAKIYYIICINNTKRDTMAFTYSDDCFSDLHKDVYGFRPRGIIMDNWNSMAPEQKQARWDQLCAELEANSVFEKEQEAKAVKRFEARVQDVIELGAGNRTNALLWISQTETFYHIQDVEHFVWEQGILFTDYGKQLIKELAAIVDYKDMELG
jgi:hypothetical protein